MRLIDAGKAKLSLDWNLVGDVADAACRVIDNAPTVDAVPVAHGKWKYYHKQNKAVCTRCSEVE